MKSRCYNADLPGYRHYGGRGITVCPRWEHNFENFLADMGRRPSKTHSIDRRKVNLGYSPENCVWATKKEQTKNRRQIGSLDHFTDAQLLAEVESRGLLARVAA